MLKNKIYAKKGLELFVYLKIRAFHHSLNRSCPYLPIRNYSLKLTLLFLNGLGVWGKFRCWRTGMVASSSQKPSGHHCTKHGVSPACSQRASWGCVVGSSPASEAPKRAHRSAGGDSGVSSGLSAVIFCFPPSFHLQRLFVLWPFLGSLQENLTGAAVPDPIAPNCRLTTLFLFGLTPAPTPSPSHKEHSFLFIPDIYEVENCSKYPSSDQQKKGDRVRKHTGIRRKYSCFLL